MADTVPKVDDGTRRIPVAAFDSIQIRRVGRCNELNDGSACQIVRDSRPLSRRPNLPILRAVSRAKLFPALHYKAYRYRFFPPPPPLLKLNWEINDIYFLGPSAAVGNIARVFAPIT